MRFAKNRELLKKFYGGFTAASDSSTIGVKSADMVEAFRCSVLTVCVGSPIVFPELPEIVVVVSVVLFPEQHFRVAARDTAREIRGDRGGGSLILVYTLTKNYLKSLIMLFVITKGVEVRWET